MDTAVDNYPQIMKYCTPYSPCRWTIASPRLARLLQKEQQANNVEILWLHSVGYYVCLRFAYRQTRIETCIHVSELDVENDIVSFELGTTSVDGIDLNVTITIPSILIATYIQVFQTNA